MNWVVQLARNFIIAALIIGIAQRLKGRELDYVIEFSVLWGAITAAIFTGTQYYKWRRCQACAVCEEPPKSERAAGEAMWERALPVKVRVGRAFTG